ncbi:glycosyltransferase [Cereibacter sphaeroides]|uniref:CgeB family protein n=1 Tax=Cereibacter sphaeroides TaxID=1063 RepID=UPI001F28D7E9|nr:glycosyltransferase [Cereibacter sphaeroides]MCE6950189.1 glycosyltransferase [Cereibacter sphaeroides]
MSLDIVIIGLTLSSSWGNGHATTYRALLRGLAAEGHRVLFLERDVPWYAANRDLPEPDFCDLRLYGSASDLTGRWAARLRSADAVIIGSYVPEGREVIDAVAALGPRLLCFYDIDTPVTMDLLDRREEEFLAARQVPRFDIYFSFSGGEVLRHLEESRGAREACALYCSVDPEYYRPLPVEPQWDLGYLGTYSPDRQPTLEALLIEPARRLPGRRFVVAGPSYPDGIDWPANVERIEHLAPGDHAAFYSSQRYTLNVTRAAMRRMGWSPSVRLFEAAACGVPVISDEWRGLDELLPDGEAILIASTPEDVVRILEAGEGVRQSIGRAARARVLKDHTGQARALELVEALRRQTVRAA